MDEYYEKCDILHKKYMEKYNKLVEKIEQLDVDEEKKETLRVKYVSPLLSDEDMETIMEEKIKILAEYELLKEISTEEEPIEQMKKIDQLINETDIGRDPVSYSSTKSIYGPTDIKNQNRDMVAEEEEPKKISTKSMNNKNLGKVIKGPDAEEFSKMLENFKFTSGVSDMSDSYKLPIINVSPVQIVNTSNCDSNSKPAEKRKEPEHNKKREHGKEEAEQENQREHGKEEPEQEKKREPARPKTPELPRNKSRTNKDSRTFTIYYIGKDSSCEGNIDHGRYRAADPVSAAKKAFNRYCNSLKRLENCNYYVAMRETTRGSRKGFHTYQMRRVTLDKPIIRFEGPRREYSINYKTDIQPVKMDCDKKKI